ncbi:MAG: indole-3-glycerol phosphate synthase TrpC [Dehalococcoidia bacterium]|nr:indole-3-glycerol phosphate synthase TrpC [Dehalococcoidia bacterium]
MTILDKIVAENTAALERHKLMHPLPEVERAARLREPALNLAHALRGNGVSVIAEIKKSSPSRGVFNHRFQPVKLASTYVASGASAISILTEPRYFGGSLGILQRVVQALGDDRPPILRKDFIVDPYQVFEARAFGADCILLIVALLDSRLLRELLQLSHELGMYCLVEVHNDSELDRALESGALIIGINNRDLQTFEVDLKTFEQLRPRIPASYIVVSESGIHGRDDVERLRAVGVDAVLVGEALMTADDVGAKLEELQCMA